MCTIHSLSVLDSIRQGVLRCEHWKIWGDTCQYHSPEHIMEISGRSKNRDTAPTSALHMVCVYIYIYIYVYIYTYNIHNYMNIIWQVPSIEWFRRYQTAVLFCGGWTPRPLGSAPGFLVKMWWKRGKNTWFSWKKWIGLRENLQETIDFPMKIMGLSCKFSLKPIHWWKKWEETMVFLPSNIG